jgi:hypothetical protein
MSPLLEKLRRSRETNVEVGGHNFTIKRPTDFDLGELAEVGYTAKEVLKKFVVDWPGMQEIDIIPGGDPILVKFDADVFAEWVSEQKETWTFLRDQIWELYTEHNKALETALGEQGNGSNPPVSQPMLTGSSQDGNPPA